MDTAAVAAAGAAAFGLRFGLDLLEVTEPTSVSVRSHTFAVILWCVGVLGALLVNRLYDEDTLFPGGGEFSRVVRSIIEAMAFFSIFVFLTQSFFVSRSWFALTLVLTLLFLAIDRAIMRALIRRARRSGRLRRPVLLVSRHVDPTFSDFLAGNQEFQVVGHTDVPSLASQLAVARRDTALVVNIAELSEDELWRIVIESGDSGFPVFIRAPMRQVGRDRLSVRELAGQTIVKISPPMLAGLKGIQKRGFDLVVAGIAALVTAPLTLLVAILVLVTSGPPILYKQKRLGRRGGVFQIYKFRTMREGPSEEEWTTRDDPRRTWIGRLLRRSSLDELPQLWNVLRGDMSIVGPRPEQPIFAEDFTRRFEWYGYRDRIKPGITGWAQAHGLRGDSAIDHRVEFDNWYIENWSVGLDLKIMFATVRELVRGENAY